MQVCGFKCGVYLLAILAVAIASPAHDWIRSMWLENCTESKLVVNPNSEATSVKIVTESGDTLFSVDSTNTKMKDLDMLLSYTNLLIYPEDGLQPYENNSDYFVINSPTVNGIELSIADKIHRPIFYKEIVGSNEGLPKFWAKCAHISGFRSNIQNQ